MLIPVIIPIMPGETLFSYVMRLAQANGMGINEFYLNILCPNLPNKQIGFDGYEPLPVLYNNVSEKSTDQLSYFKDHTTYPVIAAFSRKSEQDRIIQNTFGTYPRYQALIGDIHSEETTLRVCPECAQEETKRYGFWWLHREHQVPSVCACTKHHRRLLEAEKFMPRKRDLSISDFTGTDEITDADIQYADTVNAFFRKTPDCSAEQIASLMKSKMLAQYYQNVSMKDGYNRVSEAIPAEYNRYFKSSVSSAVKRAVYQSYNIVECIALYSFLFGSDIPTALVTDDITKNMFFDEAHGYELLGDYHSNGITLRHQKCGTVFQTTPHAFLAGWRCPACSKKTEQEMFRSLCAKVSPDYVLKSDFQRLSSPVIFHHKACGNDVKITPVNFLYNGSRCKCETRVLEKEAVKRFKNAGFSLVTYNGFKEPARVHGVECGHTFNIDSAYVFLRSPYCPICHPYKALRFSSDENSNREIYVRRIRELTGDEYSMTGTFVNGKTRVEFTHNTCGRTFMMAPDSFTHGHRCPYCSKVIADNQFPSLVAKMTSGVYSCSPGHRKDVYLIRNTVTGAEKELTSHMILQEIRRPTKSELLPMDGRKKRLDIEMATNPSKLKTLIIKTYPRGRLIFSRELFKERETKQFQDAIRALTRCGFIRAVAYRVYCYGDEQWDASEAIREIFIVRAGHHIGYLIDESYEFQIGLSKKAPEISKLASNVFESSTSLHKTTVLNATLFACGVPFPVNDTNYEIAALLNYIARQDNVRQKNYGFLAAYLYGKGWNRNTFSEYLHLISSSCRRQLDKLLAIFSGAFLLAALHMIPPEVPVIGDGIIHIRVKPAKYCTTQMMYNLMIELFGTTGIIVREDISWRELGLSDSSFASGMKHLLKKGMITELFKGVYTFAGKSPTPEMIIGGFYFSRNGENIGYYRGDSYLYITGIVNEKPTIYTIATERSHGKVRHIDNRNVYLHMPLIPLPSEHLSVIAFLDAVLSVVRHKYWDSLYSYMEKNIDQTELNTVLNMLSAEQKTVITRFIDDHGYEKHKPCYKNKVRQPRSRPKKEKQSENTDILLAALRRQYAPDDVIIVKDVDQKSLPFVNLQFYAAFRQLCTNHTLVRITEGAYLFSEHCNDISTETIIRKLFLEKDGHHIGYYTGESYRYTMGMSDTMPAATTIATNRRSYPGGLYKADIRDTAVFYKGTILPVNDENYEQIAMLNYICTNNDERAVDYPFLAQYIHGRKWNPTDLLDTAARISETCVQRLKALLGVYDTAYGTISVDSILIQDRILQYLKKNCQNKVIIVSDIDHENIGVSRRTMNCSMRKFETTGYLVRITNGYYFLRDAVIRPDDAIDQIFLHRKGTASGYYINDSYRYHIGASNIQPETVEIATIYRKKDTHVNLMNVMGTVVSYTYTPYDLNAIDADMAAFLHYLKGRSFRNDDIPVLKKIAVRKEWKMDTFYQYAIKLTPVQTSRLERIFSVSGDTTA